MSVVESVFKGGGIITGLAVGVGMALVAPVVIPALRPMVKSIIKTGLIAYDQGRVAVAELAERTEDILAEARSEMASVAHEAEAEARQAQSSA